MMSDPADPLLGHVVLGRYRVVRKLAKGGMGAVYLGRTEGSAGFTRPVVIKRMLADLLADPESTKMFVREAHILSNLRHPSIVGVLDFGDEATAKIMVLEYVHGYDVARWCSYLASVNRTVSIEHAIYIMTRVLEGLHHAHTAKGSDGTALMIVHRDVSPGNIMVDVEGHVKITDFGIARITGDPSEYKTQEAAFKGKIGYAPPELLQGEEPSAKSDLYSAAVVTYQMLAGAHPFRGVAVADTVRNILTRIPTPIHEVRPDAPAELSEVLERAMAKDPADRFASALDLARALQELRPSSLVDSEQDFRATVGRDFADDQMAAQMGYEGLSARDAAWREVTPPRAASMPTQRPGAIHHELIASARAGSSGGSVRPRRSAGQTALIVVLAALTLAVVGVGAVLVIRTPQAAPHARYLVVEKEHPPEGVASQRPPVASDRPPAAPVSQSAPAPAPDAAPPDSAANVPNPGDPARKQGRGTDSAGGGPDAVALTKAFNRQMGPVRSCLAEHQQELGASLSLSFSVDRTGAVKSVGLNPASLASTPGGQCILAAARAMNFGPQPDRVSFSIPITVGYK
jgi:serine/threonine protein kinase